MIEQVKKLMAGNGITIGSLFDGSGGFPLGGLLSGIQPVWASEIEPFPVRVTTKRLPFIKHYGDVSKMSGGEIEPVDIITFGSPCQDMSVAGKRAGLDGSRSNLFYEAVRIVKEMRCATDGKKPRYIVWENVPGAFSSNKGEDFKAVLEAVCKIKDETCDVPKCKKWESAGEILGDNFSVAWRVLDAQYWGVPQRRRRIYLVADFTGRSAAEILFESEGLSGDFAESRNEGQGAAEDVERSVGSAIAIDAYNHAVTGDIAVTLTAESGSSATHSGPMCIENHPTDSRVKLSEDNKVQTLTSRMGTGGMNVPLVMDDKPTTLSCNNDQTVFVPTAYGICSKDSNSMKSDNPHSGIYEADTSRTIDANGGNPGCNQGGIAVVESYALQGSMIGRQDKNGPQGDGVNEDISFTLNTVDRHAVYAVSPGGHTQVFEEKSPTLSARDYKDPNVIADTEYTVRRLTPTECARLQGFPDDWCDGLGTENPSDDEILFWAEVWETHRKIMGKSSKPKTRKQIIKWLNNPHSDSAEYKMWGNGVALPCVCFVLSGIKIYSQESANITNTTKTGTPPKSKLQQATERLEEHKAQLNMFIDLED